jgi:murein DD-endopeptidase MepM/ murein hydrolase activator NlpD
VLARVAAGLLITTGTGGKDNHLPLTAAQAATARMLYQLATSRGLPPERAREFAAAAYAESTLDPRATNPKSGAAGLYQLLSSGYRQRAQTLGGLYDPEANAKAILPDYLSYWRSHPRAAPGEAGRDVERSGEGAGFYSSPLLQALGGGTTTAAAPMPASSPVGSAPAPEQYPVRQQLLRALLSARMGKPPDLLGMLLESRRQQPTTLSAPAQPSAAPAAQTVAAQKPGKIIGTPGQGTHTLGNWESDRALDIAYPEGTPVVAPFDGVIGDRFGSLGKGGRFAGLRVHVLGQNDEAYYAHLSRFAPGIRPGMKVRAGQTIGYSGSASGVAHLHAALRAGDPYTLQGGG